MSLKTFGASLLAAVEVTAEDAAIHNALLSLFCWVASPYEEPAKSGIFVNARETIDTCIRAAVAAERERKYDISQHCVADAFWASWNENGITHKHGYYESTWMALRAALKAAAIRAEPVVGEGGEEK